jgi:hypothetical protein
MYVTNTLMGGEGASGQAAIRRGRVDGDIGIDGGLEDLRHCVGVREMRECGTDATALSGVGIHNLCRRRRSCCRGTRALGVSLQSITLT